MRSKALHILLILLMTIGMVTMVQAQSIDPSTVKPKSKIKILGNVYGGGDQAAVQGNTTVEINKGQYSGDIFGGGNGALYTAEDEADNPAHVAGTVKASADIGTHEDDGTLKEGTGKTYVTINGGEILYDDVVALDGEGHVQKDAEGNTVYTYKNPSNHNVYGGGNQACNVAGDTHVEMKKGMISLFTFFSNRNAATDLWQQWYDQAMNPNTQKKPIASVFGAGYGAHTDVAGSTNVTINIPGTTAIHPANGIAFTHTELENIDKIIQRWQPDPRVAEQFVTAVHGGGYDGTVGAYDKSLYNKDNTDPTHAINYDKTDYLSQTNVSITGQPFVFHVYGGGLGSKTGADANGSVNSHVGAVYGATKVDIQGGIINGDVFGGGAGIAGQATIDNPFSGAMGGPTVNLPYTYAAQVMRETDVTIDGKSTVIFGNVYGGGDIANTGWYVDGARPALAGHVLQQNHSLGVLDYTTSLKLNGGNILGKVFGGGNGRKKAEVEQYKFIGAVIGSTNVEVNGSTIWGDIYGGGNTGCIYSCQTIAGTQGAVGRLMVNGVLDGSTNVQILDGKVARDIFGGGYGDDPNLGDEAQASSADIYGNAFVFFKEADLEYEKYWKPREIATNDNMGSSTEPEVTGRFLAQRSGYDAENDINYRNSESDITHNLYGGGNMACTIFGNTHVYMSGAPTAPAGFNTTDYYNECIANVAKPHFSVFGGGFGSLAKVSNNAYSDINLGMGTGLHSIIGGGMNGPVVGSCQVHVGNDPMSLVHHVYGGGYYAPCHDTELEITRGTILENVFGGSVMGNIWAENTDMTKVVTKTIIGLQTPGDGRHSAVKLEDERGNILRQYAYADHKNQITIGGNVYGANDVSGTVNGIAQLTIYGGTIKGDVFGAGNGDHIGYYEPNTLRYDLGDNEGNYFKVDHSNTGGPKGNTYVGRPQTVGGVELTLEGNTKEERVMVLGQVFGGGNSCTVGEWSQSVLAGHGSNPHLTRDDPNYFVGGGKIDMNLGSHVTIGRNHAQLTASADGSKYLIDGENVSGLYMGCSGRNLATQDWSKTDNYYHHYYDATTHKYWPGFAVYADDDTTPLTRSEGLVSFRAYMNNILVWTNNVNLNIADDVEDLWLANFVGGGFRGSMKAKTTAGQFHYTLPRGVTIGHNVIGGAYNTDVVYRIFKTTDGHTYDEQGGHYVYLTEKGSLKSYEEDNVNGDYHHIEYAADGSTITGIARFYYNGGMLSELPYETNPATNTRINRIETNYQVYAGSPSNKDFNGSAAGANAAYVKYKNDALVYLDLNNKFEIEYVNDHVHGGNVFGGCFASGRVEGDIWTDYRCYQEGEQARAEDFNLSDKNFAQAKDFENNFSMMLFGAGYGKNTTIQGSAYVRVLHQEANPSSPISGAAIGYPRLYNVFGGSYEGRVEGNTNVFFNPGKYGYVTGAIYGGGCNGYVGGRTYLELAGGYIDEAYGGARNADIGGGTHVWTYDGSARWWGEDVVHADGRPFVEGDAEKAPLFIGKLYGGTDISGKICTDEEGNYTSTNGYQPYYTAEFWEKELTTDGVYNAGNTTNQKYIDTYLQVGGIEKSNHGYPIIGQIFAAGNGEKTEEFFGGDYTDALLPHQHSTLMEVSDGNIVYAFGGGNHATVTDQNYILVRSYLDSKHDIEGLGGQMYEVMKKRVLSAGVDCYEEKLVDGNKVLDLKNASIQRLFGGNNIATMAIQPKWQLISGRINNVYSGGNMGDMTYYNPDGLAATRNGVPGTGAGREDNADGSNSNYNPRGLSITIEHPDIHIVSLYGGCRLSDVNPTPKAGQAAWPSGIAGEDYYGATVNITDGYIENVYGGNDISGTVHHGTNVNISGAVSGNVYGSGNGFYLYKWDTTDTQITEHFLREYDTDLDADDKRLCYTVPASADFGGESANNTQKLLAINAARPSVEKAFLNIAGLENYTDPVSGTTGKRVAYVKGNVFCGGNASTILGTESFSKFKIGSYVTLNGVFMGSDGLAYTQNEEIAEFAKLNEITDMGQATTPGSFLNPDDAAHNPILLNVYMMAVDMKAHPKDFNLNLPLKEAHIGTYCGGGNRGSMLVDKMVELPFHHDIIIYDKIVGACLDANIAYNQNGRIIKSNGGYSRAVDVAHNDDNGNTKIKLDIASQFVPLKMDVPADKLPTTRNRHGETFTEAAAHDFLYDNKTVQEKYTFTEFNSLFETTYTSQEEFEENESEDHIWKEAPTDTYASACNIYGGCYQSGEVEGDIILNLHTNMLRYVNKETLDKAIAYNIPCFNVYGAGFGQDSHVWGNVHINMDRSLDTSTMGDIGESTLSSALAALIGTSSSWDIQNQTYDSNTPALDCSYPSFNNVFGGGRNGKLIGNSTVEIRNGLVYSDVAGGCYASDMYGSTQVIVGYPEYYRAKTTGTYNLDRADKWNTERKDYNGDDVIKQTVKYLKGDLVPNNVYEQIIAKNAGNASQFTRVSDTPSTANGARGWDDVFIKIGKGVYGGGYSLPNSTAASAGNITTHALRDDNIDLHPHTFDGRPDYEGTLFASTAGYGGNSSIMIGDQEDGTRDHIHISTLKVNALPKPYTASTKIGKFIKETIDGKEVYTHQGDGTPDSDVQYYELSGDGGVYGDGHLTFCESFRTADITRYGWADGTAKHPVLLNTFQRMDLLNINDCCLMLQGAQDFATDQIDATVYSITRINELRMTSSLDPTLTLGKISDQNEAGGVGVDFDRTKQRNYLAFFNNVHYLGAIVTNDEFGDDTHTFHEADGTTGSMSYKAKKQEYITTYHNSEKNAAAVTAFKERNVATARNAIGINNGYCLRIQNQEYTGTGSARSSQTYYGPVVGVCEVKLLTLVQGEGGGYVYADNIHEETDTHGDETFLMTSGNFVFPGIINSDPEIGNQYIVDDCFLKHYGTQDAITTKNGALDEAHYWYVEGNKYFFTTTLTGFTYQEELPFNLIDNDPNVILSGIENGSTLSIKKIEWLNNHRAGYQAVLPNDANPDKTDDYEFGIEIGGTDQTPGEEDWHSFMPRHDAGDDDDPSNYMSAAGNPYHTDVNIKNNHLPQVNIKLTDKKDNSGDVKYINHLDEPEVVKIYLEGKTQDALGNWQTYDYTITLNIVYLQGPTFEGGVKIENCALPGEWINFSSDGLKVKTPELMPITAAAWKIVPLKEIGTDGTWHWDIDNGEVIDPNNYDENPLTQNIEGHIPALYKQNEYNIAYVFTAGGKNFPVMPAQKILYTVEEYNAKYGTSLTEEAYHDGEGVEHDNVKSIPDKEERMIVVHNYHRMKDVVPQDLQIESMPSTIPDLQTGNYHPALAEAKLYIEDEADLRAFINYLNRAKASNTDNIPEGLTGLDIILQKDITLTETLPAITKSFAGTFHGDGYHIDLNGHGSSFLGSNLTGKVYNLGLIGGTISGVDTKESNGLVNSTHTFNSYEYVASDDFQYGKLAYDLSHTFNPTTYADYVANRYANGDYQYATTNRVWSLRTGTPNYGNVATHHNQEHTHDAARWDKGNQVNVPLYNGTATVADRQETVGVNIVTYKGLPAGYANDYLFFGQHLDKTSADDYPVHIDGVANGGNRVFETGGYYQSKADQKFYYNKDAWALQPTLTAIDYTNMTPEGDTDLDGDGTPDGILPIKFSVDSNKDYGSYSNATEGHVTQNLLIYNNNEEVFAYNDVDGSEEKDVLYHNIKMSSSPSTYATDYFHLVDKQDFNAPIAFAVNNRAWYERLPMNYRNVTTYGYDSGSAWEGIVLPFTAKKVTAEKNGEISHFYGDSELHHEYWLRGFVGTQTEDSKTFATFASPSASAIAGRVNFVESHQSGVDYSYPANTYFTSLFNYNDHYDTRDDEGDDTMGNHDKAWYAEEHTFTDYVPLTAEVPYIVAFPGDDFYEFSMESYYNDKDASGYGHNTYRQKATFESGATTIKVSDDNVVSTTADGYMHNGTYLHKASERGINAEGTAFVDGNNILPFRTYMTVVSSSPAPARAITIWENGWSEQIGEEPDEPQDEMDGDYLNIWAEGLDIVIETSVAQCFQLYRSDGARLGELRCKAGINRFTQLQDGIYLVGGKKLLLR